MVLENVEPVFGMCSHRMLRKRVGAVQFAAMTVCRVVLWRIVPVLLLG